ncbi:MAG: hypothetical protein RSE41_03370 [Clostridia bacterium]
MDKNSEILIKKIMKDLNISENDLRKIKIVNGDSRNNITTGTDSETCFINNNKFSEAYGKNIDGNKHVLFNDMTPNYLNTKEFFDMFGVHLNDNHIETNKDKDTDSTDIKSDMDNYKKEYIESLENKKGENEVKEYKDTKIMNKNNSHGWYLPLAGFSKHEISVKYVSASRDLMVEANMSSSMADIFEEKYRKFVAVKKIDIKPDFIKASLQPDGILCIVYGYKEKLSEDINVTVN